VYFYCTYFRRVDDDGLRLMVENIEWNILGFSFCLSIVYKIFIGNFWDELDQRADLLNSPTILG